MRSLQNSFIKKFCDFCHICTFMDMKRNPFQLYGLADLSEIAVVLGISFSYKSKRLWIGFSYIWIYGIGLYQGDRKEVVSKREVTPKVGQVNHYPVIERVRYCTGSFHLTGL